MPSDAPRSPIASTVAASTVAETAARSWVLTLSCPDRPGIVRTVSGIVADLGGNITESQQFNDPRSSTFFMRVQFDAAAPRADFERALKSTATELALTWRLHGADERMRTLIMVSRAEHCLNDLLFKTRNQDLPIEVTAVVGNHDDLRPLAEFYGVPFHHISVTKDTRAAAEAELRQLVEDTGTELIVLARYMQILSDDFCAHYPGRIINIHHSFLPSFKGARPYAQAYERGVKLIGATAHYVTADLDEGPIIEQDVERVDHTRSIHDLVSLGQDVEERALSRAVGWHAEHRILLDGHRTVVFS